MRSTLALTLILVASCHPYRGIEMAYARTYAARDLTCSDDDVKVTLLGNRGQFYNHTHGCVDGPVYEVEACGHTVVYECQFLYESRMSLESQQGSGCWREGTKVFMAQDIPCNRTIH